MNGLIFFKVSVVLLCATLLSYSFQCDEIADAKLLRAIALCLALWFKSILLSGPKWNEENAGY